MVADTLKESLRTVGRGAKKTGKIVGKSAKYSAKLGKKIIGKGKVEHNLHSACDSRPTAPFTQVELEVECRRLPKKDSFHQASAFCILWEAPPGFDRNCKVSQLPSPHEIEIDRTEIARESKNPCFKKTFLLEYLFQLEQTFILRVYDEDLRYSTELHEHTFIGGTVFTLGEIFGAHGFTIARPIKRGKTHIIITGEEITETREALEFRFAGDNLGMCRGKRKAKFMKGQTMFDLFDPFFQLERYNHEDHSWHVIFKSEVIRDTQHPAWNVAHLPLHFLCDVPEDELKIAIWDWARNSPHEFVGEVEITVDELVRKSMRGIPILDISFETKSRIFRGKRKHKNGELKVLKAKVVQMPSMLQYIGGGCELDVTFAVDCTTVNGHWSEETSLHWQGRVNDYEAMMRKVAQLYAPYIGSDGYSLWGYGGAMKRVKDADKPFFVQKEGAQDEDALIGAYKEIFNDDKKFQMRNKGDLKYIIRAATARALRNSEDKQSYSTLVILSAGGKIGVKGTIDAICTAAEDAPLSIVVIGIGDGDFREMEYLTGVEHAGKLCNSHGVPIAHEVLHMTTLQHYHGDVNECASDALHDLSGQLVQHFLNNGKKPNPPIPIPDFSTANLPRHIVEERNLLMQLGNNSARSLQAQ